MNKLFFITEWVFRYRTTCVFYRIKLFFSKAKVVYRILLLKTNHIIINELSEILSCWFFFCFEKKLGGPPWPLRFRRPWEYENKLTIGEITIGNPFDIKQGWLKEAEGIVYLQMLLLLLILAFFSCNIQY